MAIIKIWLFRHKTTFKVCRLLATITAERNLIYFCHCARKLTGLSWRDHMMNQTLMSLLSFVVPSDSCEGLGKVCLLDLWRGTALPLLLAIMNESIQTALLEGPGGMNRNKKAGENVSGRMPFLYPEMIIQLCPGSGESKRGTLWRVFLPVPSLSGHS